MPNNGTSITKRNPRKEQRILKESPELNCKSLDVVNWLPFVVGIRAGYVTQSCGITEVVGTQITSRMNYTWFGLINWRVADHLGFGCWWKTEDHLDRYYQHSFQYSGCHRFDTYNVLLFNAGCLFRNGFGEFVVIVGRSSDLYKIVQRNWLQADLHIQKKIAVQQINKKKFNLRRYLEENVCPPCHFRKTLQHFHH